MDKKFNVTGRCYPAKHYMADVSKKTSDILKMVTQGDYFIINRPRQYGKTTMLFFLAAHLRQTGDYIVFNISFEGIGDTVFEAEEKFSATFMSLLARFSVIHSPELTEWLEQEATTIHNLNDLSNSITKLANKTPKKIVILIDEVDKSSNNQLFVSFLAMLRSKYLIQDEEKTFHSVVLAGVHDVKSLKLKIRPSDETKYNSPWNIAADFKVDMSFNPQEIKPMLADYATTTGVQMDIQGIADRLFYYTSGYPFLVSKLCKIMDEDILPHKAIRTWTFDDVELALNLLIKDNNTNFDSLVKNLENNKAFYDLVYRTLIEGETIPFNPHEPLIDWGVRHGVFTENGQVKIHNRIYEQVLYNYMSVKTNVTLKSNYNLTGHFTSDNNTLDMPAVLLKFQQFMREEYSEKDKDFLERHGRLVFLSFFAPILNGKGSSFKEVQVSEEKRLDIVATYFQHKYIVELKRWYGEEYHQKGIKQLTEYLDVHSVPTGYLLIFEYNKTKSGRKEWIESEGKRIFAVWV